MFYFLGEFADQISALNVFRYITFRTGGAIMTALFFVFLFGPKIINSLRLRQGHGQPIRADGPEGHLLKQGTPTMGGLMILSGALVAALLWADLSNPYVWIVIGVTVGFGLIGFYDDYLKVTKQNTAGVIGRFKLIFQFLVALTAGYVCMMVLSASPEVAPGTSTSVPVPFFKDLLIPLGILFVPFASFVIVGASNTVNLTDGLDGLAIVPVMIASASYMLIVYLTGNAIYADYLQIIFVPGAGELAIVCGAIIGAGLGFLWFNAPPAMIFMGDTGSLSLGGAIGATAVAAKHEIVLAIIGGLFVVEGLSVMIQVASFKLFGKRVFRMAPIHHHFEQMGWKEPTIVIRFWIIAVILALVGLSTLKLR